MKLCEVDKNAVRNRGRGKEEGYELLTKSRRINLKIKEKKACDRYTVTSFLFSFGQ